MIDPSGQALEFILALYKDKKIVTAKKPITINISIDDIIRYYICIKILKNVSISKHK